MKIIKIKHHTINTIDQGEGPALLLVHGFPLDHSMWKHQIDPLSKSHRVICPDLPGFGTSPLPASEASNKGGDTNKARDGEMSMRLIADTLADLLDGLKIETVTFCGLSMGGYIGWQFCKFHSQRLEALIACDTRASADSETVARGRRVNAQSVREKGSGSIAGDMIKKLFSDYTRANSPEKVESTHAVIANCNPESVALAQLAMAQRPDATAWLAEIDVPVMLVVGQHDQITPSDEMRTLLPHLDNGRFEEIPNAGHLSPLENPTDFNRVVREFLANHQR